MASGGFGIKYPASGSLDLPARRLAVWIKDSDVFYLYVRVHATNGSDYYLQYVPSSGSPYPYGSYAAIPVGSQYRDGTWRQLNRDLDADLRSVPTCGRCRLAVGVRRGGGVRQVVLHPGRL